MASTSVTIATPPTPHSEKPAKFTGKDFKKWQQKMFFYLTTLSLQRFLKEDPPVIAEDDTDTQKRTAAHAWYHSDFLCRNYILNGLDDALYNVYCGVKTSKELWNFLEKKYKIEDAGAKKFVIGKFLDYKMVDSKSVDSQVQKIQIILHDLASEGMILNESFQVTVIIEKLPPMWKDFKIYLKHKRKEMRLEDLIVWLQIEEGNRKAEGKSNKARMEAKVHLAESSTSNKRKRSENTK